VPLLDADEARQVISQERAQREELSALVRESTPHLSSLAESYGRERRHVLGRARREREREEQGGESGESGESGLSGTNFTPLAAENNRYALVPLHRRCLAERHGRRC